MKSLQIYEYGVSEDPLQLQGQVRELKVQLENQTKVILHMQNLLRRNSLSSDSFANTPDLSSVNDQERTPIEESSQGREKKEGEHQALKDKTILLNVELERERAQNRRLSEQLQQNRSRSTSPTKLVRPIINIILCNIFNPSEIKSCTMLLTFINPLFLAVSSSQTGLPGEVPGKGAVTT